MRLSPRFGLAVLMTAALSPSLAGFATAASRPAFVSQQTSSIDGLGDYTSAALDAMGRTHVAYFDPSRDALVYAFQTQSGWRTELVDNDGMVGWYASLALDSRGTAHIAYYDATKGVLKYASRTGGAWSTQVVDGSLEGVGHYCSLALDASDNASISYYDSQNLSLRFATLAPGGWTLETVDGAGNATEAEQALNRVDRADKQPAISQDVPNVGHYSSLVIDKNGVPHVAYQDITNADLKVSSRLDGQWVSETIDARGDVGEHTSIAVDAAGRVRVSYYDLQNGALKYAAQQADGAWKTLVVDAAGDVGAYSSLELDAQGQPHISYMDADQQTLKYAVAQDGIWMTETIDGNGATGRNTSLALDRDGEPVIAYTARTGKGSFRVVSASVQFGGKPAGNGGSVLAARSLAAWPLPYKGGALNVSFVIPSRGGTAEVRMIDLAGRHVRTLARGTAEAGRQVLSWDGRDDGGRNVANGVYFLVSRTGGQESKLKLVVLR